VLEENARALALAKLELPWMTPRSNIMQSNITGLVLPITREHSSFENRIKASMSR